MQEKPNALIISDMYGLKDEYASDDRYLFVTAEVLERLGFRVKILSSLKLAKINLKNNVEDIHKLFVSYGINNAIDALSCEKRIFDIGIGFSIGGTILWKGYQRGKLPLKALICISSTRLRIEVKKINIPAIVLFGQQDIHAPSIEKVENLGAVYKNIPDADHNFYRKSEVLSQMLQAPEIIQLLDTNK